MSDTQSLSSTAQRPIPGSGDDPGWVAALRAGDAAAFTELVHACHGAMLRVARQIAGDANAEEVVQESWLKALTALPRFEGRSSLKTWLLRIVSNSAVERLRKDSRLVNDSRNSTAPGDECFNEKGHWQTPLRAWSLDTPDGILTSAELRAVIEKTIEELPPLQRAVLNMRDVGGMSMDDIRNVLDISTSNSRVLLHRARSRLWAAIDAFQGGNT